MSDNQIVSNLMETNPEFVDLISKYVAVLPGKIDEIRQAAESNSWQSLKQLAHDLNGVSGNYGFPGISELAANLESQLTRQSYNDIKNCIEQLQSLQSRVVVSKIA